MGAQRSPDARHQTNNRYANAAPGASKLEIKDIMEPFTDYRAHIGTDLARFYKTTLFQSERMLLGMDCLEPGQAQTAHQHAGRDKFYFVVEGCGTFTIGTDQRDLGPGEIAWAGADVSHSVANTGDATLVMLIGIAPEPN